MMTIQQVQVLALTNTYQLLVINGKKKTTYP